MLVIPAIDLERGRSRVVYWPGASTGVGAPTDRPDRIVERLVAQGATLIHLIDFEGARSGAPANLEVVGTVASKSAVPLQLAGGVDTADGIRLAFAAGATRVVLTTAIADKPDELRDCLAVAGDWLAVGLDPRPERLAAFPWRRATPPTVSRLAGAPARAPSKSTRWISRAPRATNRSAIRSGRSVGAPMPAPAPGQ